VYFFCVIVLNKNMLGTTKHLCQNVSGGDLYWKTDVPSTAWVYPTPVLCEGLDINAAAGLFGIEVPDVIPSPYVSSMVELGINDLSKVPWHAVIRPDVYQEFINKTLGSLWHVIDALSTAGYSDTYTRIDEFLRMLSSASINTGSLQHHKRNETNATILSALSTFEPDSSGVAKRVTYDKTSTSTGRLIIKDGPRILTLPARCRDIIGSRYNGGTALQIDFVSIEPRVALLMNGVAPPRDVYSYIAKELFDDKLDRSQVKLATLCALYGVSEYGLKKMLGNEFETRRVITGLKGSPSKR
jgi:hypothetical protein